MSDEPLYRLESSLSGSEFENFDPATAALVGLGVKGDFKKLDQTMLAAIQQYAGKQAAKLDSAIGQELHETLCHLDMNILSDRRFWQWLALNRLPDFVKARYPDTKDKRIVIGGSGLGAMNRQVFLRIYSACEALVQSGSNYSLAIDALSSQQTMQSLFESELCLDHKFCKAFVTGAKGKPDSFVVEKMKRLNALGRTISFEALTEKEIINLF